MMTWGTILQPWHSFWRQLKNTAGLWPGLLFKPQCDTFPLDFRWHQPIKVWDTRIYPDTYKTPLTLNTQSVTVPQAQWKIQPIPYPQNQVIIGQTIRCTPIPCHWEPTVIKAQPLSELKAETTAKTVEFTSIQRTTAIRLTLPETTTTVHGLTAENFTKPKSHPVAAPALKTKVSLFPIPKYRTKHNMVRFGLWQLPIVKPSIPSASLPATIKNDIRHKLAENAKTSVDNVLIIRTYRGVTPTIYQGIKVDSEGRLVCTPKAEALGLQSKLRKNLPIYYLAFGQKRDDKTPIKAFVPQPVDLGVSA